MTDSERHVRASDLDDVVVVRLSRRGRGVAWFSGLTLISAVAWGLWSPETAPAFFSWAPAQLLIAVSAAQTTLQLLIDQGRGLLRIGPDTTSVWRVGGLPRRYPSSRVALSANEEKGYLLVDDRRLSRLDLFDIKGALDRGPDA